MNRVSLYIIVVLGCIAPSLLHAQRSGNGHGTAVQPLSVKATVDRQKILIGQPIQLMLEATALNNAPLVWPGLDSLPHFDWLQKGGVDSTIQSGGRYYRQYLTLTSWDSGGWAIPRLTFTLGKQKFQTDSIRVEVAYTRVDPNKDYHDIKDIVEVPNPFSRWFGWIVAAVALLSLGIVIWLVRKKKIWKTITGAVVPQKLSPYEEALRQLDQLEKQKLPESGAIKEYYTRLGDIFRTFLLRRLRIASMAETNEELIGQLRQLPMPGEEFAKLSETLRMSDFVKFAKYLPSLEETVGHGQAIRSALGALNKIAEEREAAAAAAKEAAAAKAAGTNVATPGAAAKTGSTAATSGAAPASTGGSGQTATSRTSTGADTQASGSAASAPTNPTPTHDAPAFMPPTSNPGPAAEGSDHSRFAPPGSQPENPNKTQQ